MDDFDDPLPSDDVAPNRSKSHRPRPTKATNGRAATDGLSEENERALQEVVQGFRATWKLIAWVGRAIFQGTVVALSGLIAAWIIHRIWPDHVP